LLPYAWNVLLNPRHADMVHATVGSIEPFDFDPRLWEPMAAER
jgi:hypothetical protein